MKKFRILIILILLLSIIQIIIKTYDYYYEEPFKTGEVISITPSKEELLNNYNENKEKLKEEELIIENNIEFIEENTESSNNIIINEQKLYSENVKGYLSVDGIDINNEPILQHENDNEYYLTHNEYDEYSIWGSYFVPINWNLNSIDELQQVTIIFGHNNNSREHPRFSLLKKFKDIDFANKNQFIYLTINNETSIWQIFAVADYPIEPNYVIANPDKEYFLNEINLIKEYSYNKYSLEISEFDKILILSTCSGQKKYDTRFIVCAKLLN